MAASTKIRVLELYSGIGGMHWALKESGLPYEVVAAIDINTTANQIYRHNFPDVKLLPSSICKLTMSQLDIWNIDCILMSPPCQPFTRMGRQRDMDDVRTASFLHVLHLISHIQKKPRYVLVENVKGFEVSEARDELMETLKQCRYHFKEFLLTPLQFGIPNCRLRYYLIATLSSDGFMFETSEQLCRNVPEPAADWLTYKTENTDSDALNYQSCDQACDQSCHSILNDSCHCKGDHCEMLEAGENLRQVSVEEHLEYGVCQRLAKFMERHPNDYFKPFLLRDKDLTRFVIMDIIQSSLRKSACFTRRYGHYVEGAGSIVQMSDDIEAVKAVSLLKSKVVDLPERPQLGDEEMEALRCLQLRYFTPREIASLLCFPRELCVPEDTSTIQMYRCLGNSLNVHVVSVLIRLMCLS